MSLSVNSVTMVLLCFSTHEKFSLSSSPMKCIYILMTIYMYFYEEKKQRKLDIIVFINHSYRKEFPIINCI